MFTNASVLTNNICKTHSTNTEIIYVFVTMLIMSFKREWYLLLFTLFCLRFNITFFAFMHLSDGLSKATWYTFYWFYAFPRN